MEMPEWFRTGNVVFGDGPKDGCVKGRGLGDFLDVSLDGSQRDATPASDARLESADAKYLLPTDFNGKPRSKKVSGAIDLDLALVEVRRLCFSGR